MLRPNNQSYCVLLLSNEVFSKCISPLVFLPDFLPDQFFVPFLTFCPQKRKKQVAPGEHEVSEQLS